MVNNNVPQKQDNSIQQSETIQGKGLMLYWNASRLLDYLDYEQVGRVIKKLMAVGRGRQDTIRLTNQMEQDAFDDMLDGAISSDKTYMAKVERSRRAGKKSGEARRAQKALRENITAETQPGEFSYPPRNEQMFNKCSTNVQQNKRKEKETNQTDNKINLTNKQNNCDSSASSQAPSYHVPTLTEDQLKARLEFYKKSGGTEKDIKECEEALRKLEGGVTTPQEGASNGQCNTAPADDSDDDEAPF